MRYFVRIGAAMALAGASIAAPSTRAGAQMSTRGVPETYAITNARIVPGSGAVI